MPWKLHRITEGKELDWQISMRKLKKKGGGWVFFVLENFDVVAEKTAICMQADSTKW